MSEANIKTTLELIEEYKMEQILSNASIQHSYADIKAITKQKMVAEASRDIYQKGYLEGYFTQYRFSERPWNEETTIIRLSVKIMKEDQQPEQEPTKVYSSSFNLLPYVRTAFINYHMDKDGLTKEEAEKLADTELKCNEDKVKWRKEHIDYSEAKFVFK